jgi:hypothetical protein
MRLILAMIALGASFLWTVFVIFVNVTADVRDRASEPFTGTGSLWPFWLLTAGLAHIQACTTAS